MKRAVLAGVLLALVVAVFVYRAAPLPEQEYALDDIAFYAAQLAHQQNYSTLPVYFYFSAALQRLTGLGPVETVRATKLFFVFLLTLFFLVARTLSGKTSLALLASLFFAFNAYTFNLVVVVLRQMFAGVFFLAFILVFLRFLREPQTGAPDRFSLLGGCLFLFVGVGLTHEISFLVLATFLFLYAFFSRASMKWVEEHVAAYFLGFLMLSLAGLQAFVWLINRLLPTYFTYSKTVYGLDMLASTMTPLKVGLIAFFSLAIGLYALHAFLRAGRNASFQQKLVYACGVLSLVLLVFPVGWTAPALVYGLGFYFVFYFFYGLLARKPCPEELAVAAWFVAAAFLSRNAVLGLDFFMFRFESEVTAPFLLLAVLGLKGFFADLRRGRLTLPFADSLNAFDFETTRNAVVLGVCLLAVASNLWVVQGIMVSSFDGGKERLPVYKSVLETPYFQGLASAKLVATDEIVGLYPTLGKTLDRMTPFWAGNLDKAIKDLKDTGVKYAIAAGPEGASIINGGESPQFMVRTYSNLRTPNFDKSFDSGLLSVYSFNFNGAYYYSGDGALSKWNGG